MRGLLWVLTLFALAVGISLAARFNEGYVLLVLPPYRAEISLNLAILFFLGGFVIVYALLRGVALTLSLPGRVREFRQRRQREKMFDVFHEAARFIFEGRFSQALTKAGEAHAAGQSPALAALMAAYSARRLHEPFKQKTWLDQAAQDDPKMQSACLMLEAEMLVATRRFDEAIVLLKRLHELAGVHIGALRLELRAQQGAGQWDEVLRLVRLLEKHNALAPELAQSARNGAHRENIRLRLGDPGALRAYKNELPPRELSIDVARDYAQSLLKLEASDEAQDFIGARLEIEWDAPLVRLYGLIRGGNLLSRINAADNWLSRRPDAPDLLLALGRMCLEQQLWGKAQTCLERSLLLADCRDVHLELARVFDLTGRAEEAMAHYRTAAEREE